MSCGKIHYCQVCGDRLRHQSNRGPHESSSAFGQHIHDHYPNEFYFMDSDVIIYKKMTRIFRFIEHKNSDMELRASQKFLLPLLAMAVAFLIMLKMLDPESGVFVYYSDPPFAMAIVQNVLASPNFQLSELAVLSKKQADLFLSGQRL